MRTKGLNEVIEAEAHNVLMVYAQDTADDLGVSLYSAFDAMTSYDGTTASDIGISHEAVVEWCGWARVQLAGGL